jgi:nucleoside-diphosphate-sugar epimerase
VSYSINQVVSQLLRVSGQLSELLRAPARLGQIRQSVGDPQKAWQLLGLRATTELSEGLRQTYQHAAALAPQSQQSNWA